MAAFANGKIEAYVGPPGLGAADYLRTSLKREKGVPISTRARRVRLLGQAKARPGQIQPHVAEKGRRTPCLDSRTSVLC
jgi:hypothetical protein